MAKRQTRNLFRNDRGRWCVDVTANGRRVIRVVGDDKREAERKLAIIKADLLNGKAGVARPAKALTFQAFAEGFLKKHASLKRSYRTDLTAYEIHLRPHFGNMPLSDIRLERIEEYKAARKAEATLRKGADGKPRETSGATVNRELALLRTMLNKAVEWEYLDASPVNWRRVKKFRESGRERYLLADERERLFAALDDSSPILRSFLVLALNTGLRRGEIMGLRWANVNLDDGLICLERAQRKSGKVLRVPLNQSVRALLGRLPRVSEYVLCDPKTGKRVLNFRRAFMSACKAAGIQDLRIHDLRHTFATMLNARGADLPAISSLLGHSSITMTSKYITPITDVQRRAVELLDDAPDEGRKKDESPIPYVQ